MFNFMVKLMLRNHCAKAAFITALSVSGVNAEGLTPSAGLDPSQILGGDAGDACQMLVCLSDPIGKGLAECKEPLEKYAKMPDHKKAGFLQKCPQQQSGGKQ
jgi:hypothetical protein